MNAGGSVTFKPPLDHLILRLAERILRHGNGLLKGVRAETDDSPAYERAHQGFDSSQRRTGFCPAARSTRRDQDRRLRRHEALKFRGCRPLVRIPPAFDL